MRMIMTMNSMLHVSQVKGARHRYGYAFTYTILIITGHAPYYSLDYFEEVTLTVAFASVDEGRIKDFPGSSWTN